MKVQDEIMVSLTGGLGNQLFQLAAGLNLAKSRRLIAIEAFGKPRLNKHGNAELFDFRLPMNLQISKDSNSGWMLSKTYGYLLRMGIAPKAFEKNRVFLRILQFVSTTLFSIHLRRITKVIVSNNIGFSTINPPTRNTLLIGYFQTYRWATDPEIKQALMKISPIGSSKIVRDYEVLAASEKPLIVHVRLGDYLNQESFGIPSSEYYSLGIRKLVSTGKFSRVWLFSDDLDTAKTMMPSDCELEFRYIEDIEGSSAVTLEVMRLGFGYVIANSTFSWWAAFLCRNEGVDVIAPTPWFVGMSEPLDLIPKNWMRVKSIHKTQY